MMATQYEEKPKRNENVQYVSFHTTNLSIPDQNRVTVAYIQISAEQILKFIHFQEINAKWVHIQEFNLFWNVGYALWSAYKHLFPENFLFPNDIWILYFQKPFLC